MKLLERLHNERVGRRLSFLLLFALGAALVAAAQMPPGFASIFNGRNLDGWHLSRTDHHGSTPQALVREGVLALKQSPYGQGGLLLTDKRYRNFELYVEVKAPDGCNSGIFLRSTEGGSAYQIELDQDGGTGAFFGENLEVSKPAKAPKLASVWKKNQWNSFRIRVQGVAPHVVEWINGVQMLDVQEPRNDKVAGETDGMIGLQAHWVSLYQPAKDSFNLPGSWRPGAEFQFRHIGIRELP